jgi:hypothetical protein
VISPSIEEESCIEALRAAAFRLPLISALTIVKEAALTANFGVSCYIAGLIRRMASRSQRCKAHVSIDPGHQPPTKK